MLSLDSVEILIVSTDQELLFYVVSMELLNYEYINPHNTFCEAQKIVNTRKTLRIFLVKKLITVRKTEPLKLLLDHGLRFSYIS